MVHDFPIAIHDNGFIGNTIQSAAHVVANVAMGLETDTWHTQTQPSCEEPKRNGEYDPVRLGEGKNVDKSFISKHFM